MNKIMEYLEEIRTAHTDPLYASCRPLWMMWYFVLEFGLYAALLMIGGLAMMTGWQY